VGQPPPIGLHRFLVGRRRRDVSVPESGSLLNRLLQLGQQEPVSTFDKSGSNIAFPRQWLGPRQRISTGHVSVGDGGQQEQNEWDARKSFSIHNASPGGTAAFQSQPALGRERVRFPLVAGFLRQKQRFHAFVERKMVG